jgi:hypothetical protein
LKEMRRRKGGVGLLFGGRRGREGVRSVLLSSLYAGRRRVVELMRRDLLLVEIPSPASSGVGGVL